MSSLASNGLKNGLNCTKQKAGNEQRTVLKVDIVSKRLKCVSRVLNENKGGFDLRGQGKFMSKRHVAQTNAYLWIFVIV